MKSTTAAVTLLTLLVLLVPASVAAAPGDAAGAVKITVTAGGDSETVTLPAPATPRAAGAKVRLLERPLRVLKAGRHLATIDAVDVIMNGGGRQSIYVIVTTTAGPADATVALTIPSGTFPALVNPWAYASCGATLTDNDGNGATLTGQYGGLVHRATYNSGVVWQDALAGFTAAPRTSNAARDRVPAAGWQQIAASVTSMEVGIRFTLSANDSASISNNYALTATPPVGVAPLSVVVSTPDASAAVAGLLPAEVAARAPRALAGPVVVREGGKLLGTIEKLELVPGEDPNVKLNFAASTGSATTTFTFTSAPVAVGASSVWGYATAAVTVTDRNGNGATLTGDLTGGRAFEARYNTATPVVFAGLLGTHAASPDDTAVAVDRSPAGWTPIPGAVTDIGAEWKFTLTGGDSASGTADFGVALAGPAAAIAATAGTPQQAVAGMAFGQALEATVTDALGIPVAGATVTFTAPASGAGGTFPSGDTAVTDANGRASVPFLANALVGTYAVTANLTPPLATPAEFQLENVPLVATLGWAGLAGLITLVVLLGVVAVRRAG